MTRRIKLPVYQFTAEGFKKIKDELSEKKKDREKAVIELAEARAMGDLSENGRYKAARAALSRIDSRLRHLRKLIKYGKVIFAKQDFSKVSFGLKLTVEVKGKKREFTIVGKEEADPMKGRLSNISPIGKALIL